EVESLNRNVDVVLDGQRRCADGPGRVEHRAFLVRRIEFRFTTQHRVHALHSGDDDAIHRPYAVRVKVLDVVDVSEGSSIIGRVKLFELAVRLDTKIAAVNEEQDALRNGMIDDA